MTRLPPAARERWFRRVFPWLILAGLLAFAAWAFVLVAWQD